MKTLIRFATLGVLVLTLNACASNGSSTSSLAVSSGKIIFAAHGSSDPDAELHLFSCDADDSNLFQLTSAEAETPDIEQTTDSGWKIAYSNSEGLFVTDTQSNSTVTISTQPGDTRADFNSAANQIVYQDAGSEGSGINLWIADIDGTNKTQLSSISGENNAEWPYFIPSEDRVLFFSTSGDTTVHLINSDGTNETSIPAPGGQSVSHMAVNSDGSEFLSPQNLTSYSVANGATGNINILKSTTTLLTQLNELGYEEVPIGIVEGQGAQGTFALSADWSRDGSQLVFDALIQDKDSDEIMGIAIFVYDMDSDRLSLIYGPEPFNGNRTNNYNYSSYTPKWVP
ncbi:MAG: hypothetical protein O3A01_04315 [bacterium]|nr:hypothetical protein [bacterium]